MNKKPKDTWATVALIVKNKHQIPPTKKIAGQMTIFEVIDEKKNKVPTV